MNSATLYSLYFLIFSSSQVSYNAFVSARNDVALDVGHVLDTCKQRSTCAACHKSIAAGSVAVVAPKLGPFVVFHPACFTCSACKELLGEICTFFVLSKWNFCSCFSGPDLLRVPGPGVL